MRKTVSDLEAVAKKARLNALKMIYQAGSGHLGSSFSSLESIVAFYFSNIFKLNPLKPNWPDRDYFFLSNGHACPALYSVLSQRGFFPKEKLLELRLLDSGLEGHPKRGLLPGVEITSGSLGMGLSQAVGLALGLKLSKKDNKVVVMMSDGEQQEGSVWEALMAASHYKLDNLIALIDRNGVQIGGPTEKQMALEPLDEKYRSFGWQVITIDGHQFSQILVAFQKAIEAKKPIVIIAKTVSCKGLDFMKGRLDVHHPKVDEAFFKKAIKILKGR